VSRDIEKHANTLNKQTQEFLFLTADFVDECGGAAGRRPKADDTSLTWTNLEQAATTKQLHFFVCVESTAGLSPKRRSARARALERHNKLDRMYPEQREQAELEFWDAELRAQRHKEHMRQKVRAVKAQEQDL
jgi:hypothetical protein